VAGQASLVGAVRLWHLDTALPVDEGAGEVEFDEQAGASAMIAAGADRTVRM